MRQPAVIADLRTAHLAKLLTARIEQVEPGLGVEAMTLVAPLTEPLGSSHNDLGRSARAKPT